MPRPMGWASPTWSAAPCSGRNFAAAARAASPGSSSVTWPGSWGSPCRSSLELRQGQLRVHGLGAVTHLEVELRLGHPAGLPRLADLLALGDLLLVLHVDVAEVAIGRGPAVCVLDQHQVAEARHLV